MPEAVFLDTQVFEAASFNFKTVFFVALQKRLDSGGLELVITDITVREVHARIRNAVHEELQLHARFREKARAVRSSLSPAVASTLTELDADSIVQELRQAFDAFLAENDAEVVEATTAGSAAVFERYFTATPPFGSAKHKKNEFPDAFVIEALAQWAKSSGKRLFVVSGDELFRTSCAEREGLKAEVDLAAVLDQVIDDEEQAEFIRAELVKRADSIAETVKSTFEGLGFHVQDEWGDVEMTVTSIALDEEPEILDVERTSATVQLTFRAEYSADLSYDDSSTGIYDSEDDRQLFMDHVNETVTGDTYLVAQVYVRLDGMKPQSFQVQNIDLVDPVRGFGISTSKAADY
ncbi:MAG: PIN domain-containing protein [Vicinamibacterales bacterium]